MPREDPVSILNGVPSDILTGIKSIVTDLPLDNVKNTVEDVTGIDVPDSPQDLKNVGKSLKNTFRGLFKKR